MWNHPVASDSPVSIQLSSTAFAANSPIPIRYAGEGVGQNVSPPLSWSSFPGATVELIVVMEDAPLPSPVVHLIAAGISPSLAGISEGKMNGKASVLLLGRNTLRKFGYAGPRPIPGHGPHRYVFQIYALNAALSFDGILTRAVLLEAMRERVIARGRLDGTYERK
jgi:hypothetical protein